MTEGLIKGAILTDFGVGNGAALSGRPRNSRDARLRNPQAKLFAAMVKAARHFYDFNDLSKNRGSVVPNLATGRVPSKNLLTFPTGSIMNESGGTTPTRTNFSSVNTDPSGTTNKATRLVATANNQTFIFYRTTTCPVIPSIKYGLRFRARIPTGGVGFTLSYGLSTGLVTQSCQDLDWSAGANLAATTFETEFTYAGTGDINIRMPTTGNDMLIDRIQLYAGGLTAIPAWGAEVIEGARRAFTVDGAFRQDGGMWNLLSTEGGGHIVEPGADNKAYTAITLFACVSADALEAASSVQYEITFPTDSINGTSITTTAHLGFEAGTGATPYEGRVKMVPAGIRANTLLAADAMGMVVLAMSLSASGRKHYVNGHLFLSDSTTWAGATTNRFLIGAGSTTQRVHQVLSESIGHKAFYAVYDSQLSDATVKSYSQMMLAKVDERRGSPTSPYALRAIERDYHVFSGDSNWTQATGDWIQLISARGYFTPKRNIWGTDTAVGGTGIAEVYGNSPYPAAKDAAGRLLASEGPLLLAAAQAGLKAVYHFGVGTNDFNEILGVPAWGQTAYDNTRREVVRYLLALHPNIWVLEYTIIAAGTGSGRDYTPAGRITANANIRTRQAADTTGRHRLCDVGGTGCVLGDQTTADLGTYLLEAAPGGIHLNPATAGDAIFAAFTKTAIDSLRTAMGVDTY